MKNRQDVPSARDAIESAFSDPPIGVIEPTRQRLPSPRIVEYPFVTVSFGREPWVVGPGALVDSVDTAVPEEPQ
jgi:hypothetical protein